MMHIVPRTVFARLLASGLLALVAVVALGAGQPPGKEEPTRPPAGRSEEEVGAPPVVRRVEDPDIGVPDRVRASAPGDVDLARAARTATHPALRKLYQDLALPRDLVQFEKIGGGLGRQEQVRPLSRYLGNNPRDFKGDLTLTPIDQDGNDTKPYPIPSKSLVRVDHYEELARTKVSEFLNQNLHNLPAGDLRHLSRPEQLTAAEQAIGAVLRYHESARERGIRREGDWDRVRDTLRAKLLDWMLERLDAAIDKSDWEEALALAKEAAGRFPSDGEQDQIAKKVAPLVEGLLKSLGDEKKYREVRQRLREFEERFPGSKAGKPIREKLMTLAQPMMDRARALRQDGKVREARELARQAEEVYPGLPGLSDLLLDLEEAYPTLRVGVRELPVFLSPALAFTDSERQAVELLFEGLVEHEAGRFVPGLASARPQMIPLGRQFPLPRNATWSDGSAVTAEDVRATAEMLRKADWSGRVPAWADDLVDRIGGEGDSYRVRLTLKQGHLSPLSLMAFKVLPAGKLPLPDDKDFAQKPIGSGPYRFVPGSHSDRGRPVARFTHNPDYRTRPGKGNLRLPREILFVVSTDPARDFAEGRIDLHLDVPSSAVAALGKAPNVTLPAPIAPRRVYFLAVNNRHRALADPVLRRALALAVPRQKLLDDHFRHGAKVHRPLNGPYPAGTWASSPSLPADPYSLDTAKEHLEKSGKKGQKLTLKYPSGDPAVKSALEALRDHWKEQKFEVELDLRELPPHNLRDDVEKNHDYELAYYFHDYADETFWLRPLLDPRSVHPGGPNYLGYTEPEGEKKALTLEKLLRDAEGHRDFDEVRRITHLIHQQFAQRDLPFIPLWQLDRQLAHVATLKFGDPERPVSLDPLRAFGTLEQWKLNRSVR